VLGFLLLVPGGCGDGAPETTQQAGARGAEPIEEVLQAEPRQEEARPELLRAPAAEGPLRLVLVGLDAATWVVMRPLLVEGALPHFASLIERGVAGELETFQPTESPLIWTSIATGVSPARHGIQTFTRRLPGSDTQVPLRSDFRRVAAFWNLISAAGHSVVTVKWWASWPAEPVKGATLSSRLQRDLESGQTWPATLFPAADPFRFTSPAKAKAPGTLVLPGKGAPPAPPRSLETTAAEDRSFDDHSVARLSRYILAKYRPRVFATYFKSIDKLEHFRWRYHDYRRRADADAAYRKRGREIDALYIEFDALLGDLARLAGPNTVVMVVSDHGMVLREEVAELYDVSDLDGDKVLAAIGALTRGPKGTRWEESTAYTLEHRPYSRELLLRINLAGREPQGSVPPDRAPEVCLQLARQLRDLRTVSGKLLFTTVAADEHNAEITALINRELILRDRLRMGDDSVGLDELIHRVPQPEGVHVNAPPGVFLAAGGPLRRGARIHGAHVFDICPTILYLLDLPIPRDLDGRVLEEAIDPAYLAAHPPRFTSTGIERREAAAPSMETLPGDEEILDELRALGYIQ
jgi:predicted AlkP superfamily phosphohydrolase/phosphomutase